MFFSRLLAHFKLPIKWSMTKVEMDYSAPSLWIVSTINDPNSNDMSVMRHLSKMLKVISRPRRQRGGFLLQFWICSSCLLHFLCCRLWKHTITLPTQVGTPRPCTTFSETSHPHLCGESTRNDFQGPRNGATSRGHRVT